MEEDTKIGLNHCEFVWHNGSRPPCFVPESWLGEVGTYGYMQATDGYLILVEITIYLDEVLQPGQVGRQSIIVD